MKKLLCVFLFVFVLSSCGKNSNKENTNEEAPDGALALESTPKPTAFELSSAVMQGNTEEVRRLLAVGVDVHAFDEYGFTALHAAASRGRPEVIRVLLGNGAKVNMKTGEGDTPLHYAVDVYAVEYGNPAEAVRLLLLAGADVNAKNNAGETPLGYGRGRVDVNTAAARLLREAGGTR